MPIAKIQYRCMKCKEVFVDEEFPTKIPEMVAQVVSNFVKENDENKPSRSFAKHNCYKKETEIGVGILCGYTVVGG